MNIDDRQQDLIDRFLQGSLDGAELDRFLLEIEKNSILKKELQNQQEIMEGIEFHGNKNLRQRFSKISEEVKKERKSKGSSNGKIIRFILVSAAAIALLVMVSNLFFQNPDSKDLYAQFYTPYQFSNDRSSSLNKETAAAHQFYNKQDYTQAIPILKTILETQPNNTRTQLAYGNALMHTDQDDLAILEFQKIINRKDNLYSDQAKWFLALVYLKTEKLESSKSLLQQLSEDTKTDFHKEAKELLSKLSD